METTNLPPLPAHLKSIAELAKQLDEMRVVELVLRLKDGTTRSFDAGDEWMNYYEALGYCIHHDRRCEIIHVAEEKYYLCVTLDQPCECRSKNGQACGERGAIWFLLYTAPIRRTDGKKNKRNHRTIRKW